jgi:hypothetical protein
VADGRLLVSGEADQAPVGVLPGEVVEECADRRGVALELLAADCGQVQGMVEDGLADVVVPALELVQMSLKAAGCPGIQGLLS